ncbi:MAG: hypothetical protein ACLQUY_04390 [Ktedonobacterales bacterium]
MPTDVVTIIDPAHPLCGQTLPLIGVTNKQYIGRACVVWIQPGIERLVPLWATSLAEVTAPAFPCRVSVAALRALLTVGAAMAQLEVTEAAELEVPHEHPEPEDNPDPAATTALTSARRRTSQFTAPAGALPPARAPRLEDPESGATAAPAPDLAPRAEGGRP